MDECLQSNGGCSDVCINEVPGFRCDCPMGSLLNEFDGRNCIASANCSFNEGNVSCDCLPGYQDFTGGGLNCTGTAKLIRL